MKKKLLNSMRVLLVAAGLCVGANDVWADSTPVFNQDFTAVGDPTSTNPADYGFAEDYKGGNTTISVSDGVFSTVIGNNANSWVSHTATFSAIGEGKIVTISYDWTAGNATGKAGSSNSTTSLKDASGNAILTIARYGSDYTWKVNGSNVSCSASATASQHITATINMTTKKVTSLSIGDSYSVENLDFQSSSATTISKFSISQSTGTKISWTNTSILDNLSISTEDYGATTATVTFKYVDTDMSDLSTYKGDVESVVETGTTIESLITDALKTTFYDAGTEAAANYKYTYSEYTCTDETVAAGGSTVYLKFAKATKVTYTLDCVDANDASVVIKNYTTYAYDTDATMKQYYPKGIKYDGNWYIAASEAGESGTYYGKTLSVNTPATVKFTKRTDVETYYEAESITFRSKRPTELIDYADRYSDGKSITIDNGAIFVGILSGGIYNIRVGGRGRASSAGTLSLYYGVKNDNFSLKETSELGTLTWGSGVTGEMTIKNAVIPANQYVALNMGNSNLALDYVYFEKVTSVSTTVGANGYTTFASSYALDLTDENRPTGLKAYKATLDGSTLTFTKLNQTVPAGTGLLLLGETNDGTYNIPVVANGDAVTNALVGVTSDTPLQSTVGGTYYFVMKKATTAEDALAFAPLSTSSAVTIPAGKAYVALDTAGARSLTVAFDDETTGINSVNGEGIKANGFYNLNGQRVENPTKGLYIMNGKKVILK